MKRQYYWLGMCKHILKHCKACHQCSLQNQSTGEIGFGHFKVPLLPMEFICMDLVGPISPQTSRGNKYMLTIIDMLTGYTMAVTIPDKRAETVCRAYRDHIYCIFGGSSRILTDNGTEFKSKEMRQICDELDIKQVFSPVYTPQANGRLEGWHRFLKSCIAKHIRGAEVEWDDLIPLAVSAYNFFPCQSSKESPFVLMFGRDPITLIAKLLEPKLKFYGEKGVSLRMDTLRKLYTVTAENIRKARESQPWQETPPTKLRVNDLVLVKDPEAAVFEPRYMPNYRITAIYRQNRIEVQDERGNKSIRRAAHVKSCAPVDKTCEQLPPQKVYEQYGRASKLLIHPKDVPHIPLEVFKCEQPVRESEESEADTPKNHTERLDTIDESRCRENTAERAHSEAVIEGLTEMKSTRIDTVDESRSQESVTELCEEAEIFTLDLTELQLKPTKIDTGDESRSRRDTVTTSLMQDGYDEVQKSTSQLLVHNVNDDDNDESGTRKYRSTLTVMCGQKQRTIASNDDMDNGDVTVLQSSKILDSKDKSRSRSDSCSMSESMSHDQRAQLPDTCVLQDRCMRSTVLSAGNIDKCLVTNKQSVTKQNSVQMGNQWLSSTFSRFTSSVLGKSKNSTGEEFMENTNVVNNQVIPKPKFNFFL